MGLFLKKMCGKGWVRGRDSCSKKRVWKKREERVGAGAKCSPRKTDYPPPRDDRYTVGSVTPKKVWQFVWAGQAWTAKE